MIDEVKLKLKHLLRLRRHDYVNVFLGTGETGKRVLSDLAVFCRANDSAFHEDSRAHAVLEGRREVWLRIQRHLRLSDEELWRLSSGEK